MKIKIILTATFLSRAFFVQAQLLAPEIKVQSMGNGTLGSGVVEIFNEQAPQLLLNYNDIQQYKLEVANQTNGSFSIKDLTDDQDRLTINGEGMVGIGISPEYKLHVADRMKLDGASAGMWVEAGSNDWFIGRIGSNLRIHNNGDKVTFQSNGNVGIGTTSPAAKLEVSTNTLIGDGGDKLNIP